MNMQLWYQQLDRPFFAPEPWVFGLAWGIIYPLLFVAFAWIIYLVIRGDIRRMVLLPLVVNLVFNLSFTYIQFSLQNNLLAMVWIITVLLSLGWIMYEIYNKAFIPWLLLVPYALWGSFATVLQISITYLNW